MRRIALVAVGAALVAAGLTVHLAAPDGFVSDAAGDALYAALIYVLVAFLGVRMRAWAVAVIALAWCTAVELFQLTGWPEQWGIAFRPLMLVFGTVFSPWDLLFYLVGIACVALVDGGVRALRERTRREREPGDARP